MPADAALSTPPAAVGLGLRPSLTLAALALGAVGLGCVALGLAWVGFASGAMIVATSAITMALVGGALALARRMARHRRDRSAGLLAQAFAHDPDAVCVTDRSGRVSAVNLRAADCPQPEMRLRGWCVDPGQVVAAVLAEVGVSGHATREFRRQDNGLRISAHAAEGLRDVVIWRFSPVAQSGQRTIDSLGLPIVSREGGEIVANAAARALIDLDSPSGRAVIDAALDGTGEVTLADGTQLLAVGTASRDGPLDVVLLPARTGLAAGTRALGPGTDFDDIPVALANLSSDGRITGTNRLARLLLGLSVGEPRFFWEVVEGLGRPVSDWLEDARAGRALGRPEVLRATLTGQETFVQIILRRGIDGALVAVISDATELKSLEARFVPSQKMQAIGQLAGGIAHDFNNLLTAIAGHCDLLLLNRDRFDPDYDDLLQIHQNSNRAAALVRQLLAFSRKQTLKTEVLTLESLLEDLTHLLTRLVGERISLVLDHDPDLGAIRADRRQLEQVIMNLVVNARDAMPMGGVIRIETRALQLGAEMEYGRARVPAGTYALIRVIDQGIGIPADIVDKIFEPFFTTKKVGEGTGLGLSTAYGIVKQMGGFIFCDSVEGSGTTFSLYFALADTASSRAASAPGLPPPPPGSVEVPVPVARPAPRTAPRQTPAAEVAAGSGRGRAVLLVEDEAPVRAFAARALRHQGYQVFEAQDGEQALEFLEDPSVQVDIFVTDVIMPGIDGPGWVTQALDRRPQTPVVFVSGYTEDTLSAALTRIPRAVFLGKPFSLGDLTETIARQIAS